MSEPILLSPKIKELYVKYIPAIKHQFGTSCTIEWNESEDNCYNCFYDAVKKQSTGRYRANASGLTFTGICPICSGVGKLIQTGSIMLSGNLTYSGPFDAKSYIPGGQFDDVNLEISTLRSEMIIPSGIYSGRLACDVMKHVTVWGERWCEVKKPEPDGFIIDGQPYKITLRVKLTNKR